jgi:hypothetical protein
MRRMLTALVVTLPLCLSACASYAVHLYSDPRLLKVIDERVVLTDGESESTDPLAVLMRGDSVVVIGERRNNWEYEQDMHDRTFVVYYNNRRSYVPYRSLITSEGYASLYGTGGTGATPASTSPSVPSASIPSASIGTGAGPARDSVAASRPSGDLTGGSTNNRRRRR